jgi:HEAT repeat protein
MTLQDFVAQHLDALRKGDFESALCRLVEAGPEVLPYVESAFRDEKETAVRVGLVRVVWEQRRPQSVPFLARALDDPSPEVQKTALDGLVTIGGPEVRRFLESALMARDPKGEWADWLREALNQLSPT